MAKKVTKSAGKNAQNSGTVGMIPKNLTELRAKFDGFRDVAKKLEDGSIKTQLMNEVESFYIAAGYWFEGLHLKATEAHG